MNSQWKITILTKYIWDQDHANTIRGINNNRRCHGNCDSCTVLSNMLFCTRQCQMKWTTQMIIANKLNK